MSLSVHAAANITHGAVVGGKATPEYQAWKHMRERCSNPREAPSINFNYDEPQTRCHSIVTDGRIHFIEDSHHALRGQTGDLPEVFVP